MATIKSIEEKAKAYDSNYKNYAELINRLEDVKEAIKKQNYGIAMNVLCKPYPEFQVTKHSELKESENDRIRKLLIEAVIQVLQDQYCSNRGVSKEKVVAWLEKQGNLMKALQISNAKIGELIEKNYYLREQLEKQGEHTNFLNKIQIGDKVTRNEDGVLVNLSQLNRVAKKDEKQGKNNMGISEATKQKLEDNLNKALEKETPESWNKFLDEQGEQKSTIEMITPEESLGIDSDTYNKIVDECVYGEQKPIKEHDVCEFCEDRYGCVNPCSMKLVEEKNPTDKTEHKFKVGDEIRTGNDESLTITKIDEKGYWSENLFICDFDEECIWDLVEQKPTEEYNITGIGSKHATGKLAEKIKELDEKTKELELLKQGEQKPFGQRDECLHCQFNYAGECKGFCAMKRSNRKPHKPANKIESKFKVGDWVVWDNKISCHVDNIYQGKNSLMYTITDTNNMTRSYSVKGFDNNAHLWTIQDAKDGDVLATKAGGIFIYKELLYDKPFAYCGVDKFGVFKDCNCGDGLDWTPYLSDVTPATKEQRDQLEKAMTDAGYTFDFEKKELKKIESRQEELTEFEKAVKQVMEEAIECGDTHNLKADADMLLRLVQKSSWSKEDEWKFSDILALLRGGENCHYNTPDLFTWLKNLKDRVQPQPKQEWSDYDECMLTNLIDDPHCSIDSEYVHWLKFLKDRYTWKPSDEQMDALRYVTNFDYGGYKATLVSLYEQLKKLKGE